MPAHEVECPVCFATLKLKAAPSPGAKLKCPQCGGAFSPGGEPVETAPADDEPEALPARPKGRVAQSKQKPKAKPVNWMPAAIGVGAVLLLVAIGIGLYLAKDLFPKAAVTVDLAYCRLDNPSLIAEFRVQEFLQAPAVPAEVRTAEGITQTSAALKELLGVELADVEVIESQGMLPAGFNPMVGAATTEQLIVIKSSRPLVPPQGESTDVEGIACFAIHADPPRAVGMVDTLFLANANTAVFGREATVRALLGKWKVRTPPAGPVYQSGQGTVVIYAGEDTVRQVTEQLSRFPLLALGLNPRADPDEEVIKAGDVLKTHAAGASLSVKCAADVSMSVSLHARDTAGVQQMQTSLEALRQKLQAPLNNLVMMGAMLPPAQRDAFALLQQILATPLAASSDRVSLGIPVPADQQTEMLKSLTASMPTLVRVKLGRGSPAAPTPAAAALPSPGGESASPSAP